MSQAELDRTQETGLVRGGREGTHFVTNDTYATAAEAQNALALPVTPTLEAQLEVPLGVFSDPSVVDPFEEFAGGGTERMATGPVPTRVVGVRYYGEGP